MPCVRKSKAEIAERREVKQRKSANVALLHSGGFDRAVELFKKRYGAVYS